MTEVGEMNRMTGNVNEAEVGIGIGRTGRGEIVVKAERGVRRRTKKTGELFTEQRYSARLQP